MASPYECEVRFPIADVEEFRRRILFLGGRALHEYAFSDHYQRPRSVPWDVRTRTLRIREHYLPAQPSEVLLTAVELLESNGLRFKRSRFAEGKIKLYVGEFEQCRTVVEHLGFVPWFVVRKRDGTMYDVPVLGTLVVEHVANVGWMSELEVEGADPSQAARVLREKLQVLGIHPETVSADPVAAIVAARGTGASRKVYFSESIRGGRALQPVYTTIVAFLQQRGYEVLTAHVADPDVLDKEWKGGVTASDIYTRDLRWLEESDLVIAEVSTPSLGVGVEIMVGQHLGKPVICLCQKEVTLSAMVGGNAVLHLIRYQDEPDLLRQLDRALASV